MLINERLYRNHLKRLLDFCISTVALLILAPLLLFVALSILLLEGRPILFVQERVGLGGHTFKMFKFRTMTTKSRDISNNTQFDAGNTSRVTSIGKFLRATKLDELPQLCNVLKGDMAVVGPRPEVPFWVEQFPERWSEILVVRPGLSDRASIVYRDEEVLLSSAEDPDRLYRETIMPGKLALYEEYIDQYNFQFDFKIIIQTLNAVFKREG